MWFRRRTYVRPHVRPGPRAYHVYARLQNYKQHGVSTTQSQRLPVPLWGSFVCEVRSCATAACHLTFASNAPFRKSGQCRKNCMLVFSEHWFRLLNQSAGVYRWARREGHMNTEVQTQHLWIYTARGRVPPVMLRGKSYAAKSWNNPNLDQIRG